MIAINTLMPEEEQGHTHHDRTNQMPRFPATIFVIGVVTEIADDRRCHGIGNLTNQNQQTCIAVANT